ncbi:lymphatic vessel endothelial hyaluronic acid receptor 1 [Bufo gargarizans]|uniref:lymphatic vessel endothelial hyaluronic acid receptor 1 n=1 Tax=Bufo gargarizans TaxID=30331 RepID=UPI001CF4A8A5|nr:lymphatic vessel endothelial hyaluronic acid receptor 1 [Bufo gargarizans]
MSAHFGVLLLCLVLGDYLSASSVDVSELTQSKCRIAGVVLVENQDRSKKFNFTMAEDACQALGLQLASEAQVEKAKGYGYETCSFGWVLEKAGVIPRIQNNENCGRNKTGVITWKVELHRVVFSAYCFNASDVRINSCKPGLMVTQPPSTAVVPTSRATTASSRPETESTSLEAESTSLEADTQTTAAPASRPHVTTMTAKDLTTSLTTTLTTPAMTPRSTTIEPTPVADTEPPNKQENQMAQKTERVVFGGVPTTLLILALLFFIAAVVLAVCYIKKYKTHLLFTKKKKQKECVEAKVFKDTSGAENTKEEERPPNGKEAESPWKPTGNSIEAEV